jgi:hypothetical protein
MEKFHLSFNFIFNLLNNYFMSTVSNNRISVTLDDHSLVQIKGAFVTISKFMPFLIGLNPDERQTMPKMNVANKQFVYDALMAMNNNQSLFPTYLSAVELNKDFTLFSQLDELVSLSQQLTEKLRDTQILAGSEAYVSALSVYKMVSAAAQAGMPGADTVYDQLAERFAGQGISTAALDTSKVN